MLESRTTFIVGAGACADINLPTGPELRRRVSAALRFEFQAGQLVSGEWEVQQAIRRRAGENLKEYFQAAAYISREVLLARSIDDFIDANQGNAAVNFCGKLAIAKCIVDAERGSKLYFSPSWGDNCFDIDELENSWFAELFRIIQVGHSQIEDIFNNISIVVFNYDRCIEHFLFHAVRRFYRLDDVRTAKVLSKLRIFHPYGSLGELPWMELNDAGAAVPFGLEAENQHLAGIADRILTYTESVSETEGLIELRSHIESSEKLIFLGFAFHRQNMRLIKPVGNANARRVYATAYSSPHTEVALAEDQINSFCGGDLAAREVHLINANCDTFIRDYARPIQYA